MNENYLVSVWITTRNRPEMLNRAIESVLNQTYTNIEIIVVDDFSSDEVVKEIKSKEYPNNVRFIFNERNMGACYSRNIAIKSSHGTFVTGLDDDDEFTNNRVYELIKAYVLFGDRYSLYCSHTIVHGKKGKTYEKPYTNCLTIRDLLKTNRVGSQALVKRDYMINIGGFDENLVASQDHDMWLRVIEKYGEGYKLDSVLYISHDEEIINRISAKKLDGLIQFYNKHKHKMNGLEKLFNIMRGIKMLVSRYISI